MVGKTGDLRKARQREGRVEPTNELARPQVKYHNQAMPRKWCEKIQTQPAHRAKSRF